MKHVTIINVLKDAEFYTTGEAISRKKQWEEKYTALEEQREDLEKKLKLAESAEG